MIVGLLNADCRDFDWSGLAELANITGGNKQKKIIKFLTSGSGDEELIKKMSEKILQYIDSKSNE